MRFFLLLTALGLSGCSLKSAALRSTAALLEGGAGAFYEEPDPALAKDAMAGQLKLLEVLLRNEPDNARLNLLAAEGFNGYAFLFLEDSAPERAKALYERGRDYGLKALARKRDWARLRDMDLESLEKALGSASKADVPALFWTAFGWANAVNLAKDSPEAVSELPKAVALMKPVLELGPDFNFAGADLFFGLYYASRPPLLGGNLGKAKAHFQEARRRTQGRYLMGYWLEARYYAVAAQDRELFADLLKKIKEAAPGSLPDARLADQVAKGRAKALLEKADDYF
ncbi:MAG: hypothetical protein HY921_12275 [Elusimicrobia bacterium]|nr:hypothetical protein [Elusimicrobiota bacterium]